MTEDLVWLFLLNAACGLIMTGIIWFLQIVYYPALPRFHRADFKHHFRRSGSRVALLGIPFMVAELLSGIFLVLNEASYFYYHLGALILVLLVWLSTLFVQLPANIRLQKGYDEDLVKRLSDTNWLRTILWSVKSLVILQALLLLISS